MKYNKAWVSWHAARARAARATITQQTLHSTRMGMQRTARGPLRVPPSLNTDSTSCEAPRGTCSPPCSVSSCTPHFASRSTSSELGLHLRATLYMVTCQWGPLQPIHRLLSCLAHAGSTARSSRHVFTQRSVTQCLTRGHPRSSMLGHQRAALYPPMRTPSHSQAAVVPRPRSAHAVTCALAQAFSASLLVVRFDHPWQWLWRWNLCWLVHE